MPGDLGELIINDWQKYKIKGLLFWGRMYFIKIFGLIFFEVTMRRLN